MNTPAKSVIKSFKDIFAWQEGHKLVLWIYKETKKFPKEEIFALTNQMRRAAVSLTSNIAEGFGRKYYKEKREFYYISRGSLDELENQMIVARDIGYMPQADFKEGEVQLRRVQQPLNSFIKKTEEHIRVQSISKKT